MAVFAERSWAGIGAQIGVALVILALVLLVLGPLGWRLGWWHYRLAFYWLMPGAGFSALAGAVLSVLALAFGWSHLGGRGLVLAGVGSAVGAVLAYVPWQYNHLRGVVPPIHDITTDTENPPAFVAAVKLRPAGSNTVAYEGAALAGKQKAAYPDITPVKLSVPPADAFKRA